MGIPFIQAKNCGPPRPGGPIFLIVIHTMESPEKPHTAENVARWFNGPQAPYASAHYCIDAEHTVQCVKEDVVAWAAPGANRFGIHLEHAGYAGQNAHDWEDDYSTRMLIRSATLAADITKRYNIPVAKLSALDLHDPNAKGICGHWDVTVGRNRSHGHTDPGFFFPWGRYLALIRDAMNPEPPPVLDVA